MPRPLRTVIRQWLRGADTDGDSFTVEPIAEVLAKAAPVQVAEARGLPGIGRAVRLLAGVGSQTPLYAVRHVDTPGRITEKVSPTPQVLADADRFGVNPGPGWRWAVFESLAWFANVFARQADPDQLGYPRQLPLFETADVWWDRDRGRWEIGGVSLAASEVLHIKRGAPAGKRMGVGILGSYQNELKLIRAAEQAQFVLLDHGVPTGLLSIDKDSTATPADAERMKERWHESQRKRSVAVLKAVQYTRVGFNADELSMVPTREFNLRLASDMSGVPPYMLGVPSESRVYTNAETEWQNFIRTTMGEYFTAVEHALSGCLPSRGRWEQQARFDLSVLTRGDAKTRWETYAIAAGLEAMTRDEIRDFEGLGPHPDSPGSTDGSDEQEDR